MSSPRNSGSDLVDVDKQVPAAPAVIRKPELFRRNEPKVGWYRVDSPLSTFNVMSVGVFEYKESTVRIKQKKKQNKKLGIRRGKKWETG